MKTISKKIKYSFIILMTFTYSLFYTPTILQAETNDYVWPIGPSVYADAAIVMEASTGLILYEKNIYETYFPASITKIMTALLALENNNLNETVTMSYEAEWNVDFNSSRIGLVEGEQLSLEDALYGIMLESANEVSYAIGEHVANGPITAFSEMMNKRAKELGCVNSNFTNPNGLHDNNHYTCAYDMALISRAAIAIPQFRTIIGTRTHVIPPTNKNVSRPLANHHRYIRKTLNYDGAIGGKTGGTTEALTTLVTFAERNGLLLIAIVLHVDTALHAYEDTSTILNFGFDNFSYHSIKQTELGDEIIFPSLFKNAPRFKKEPDSLIQVGKNSNVILPKTANFKDAKKAVSFTPVDEFVHGENVIGQISYTFYDKYVGFADIIYYNEKYPLTKAEFDMKWPSYLLHPTTTNITIENLKSAEIPNKTFILDFTDESNKIPLIYGIVTFIITLLIGFIIILFIIPSIRSREI